MAGSHELPQALLQVDFSPIQIDLQTPTDDETADVVLRWGQETESFASAMTSARSLGEVRSAVVQAKRRADARGLYPLVVVPYLSDESLALLQDERVSGLDLSGNGIIEVPGRWRFLQRGYPNRYPRKHRSREPYRGKSALVGRALLARPRYEAVGEVHKEIERRGGTLSLSQVSKVLSALEDDLVIRKTSGEIRLLQPAKLLDALAEDYRRPEPTVAVEAKASLGPAFYADLLARAETQGVRLVGYDPQRVLRIMGAG
jgi:hypothetical protein